MSATNSLQDLVAAQGSASGLLPQGGPLDEAMALAGNTLVLNAAGDAIAVLGSSTLIGTDANANPYLQSVDGVLLGFDSSGDSLAFNSNMLMDTSGFVLAASAISPGSTAIWALGGGAALGLDGAGNIVIAQAFSSDGAQISSDGSGDLSAVTLNLTPTDSSLDAAALSIGGEIAMSVTGNTYAGTLPKITLNGGFFDFGFFQQVGGIVTGNGGALIFVTGNGSFGLGLMIDGNQNVYIQNDVDDGTGSSLQVTGSISLNGEVLVIPAEDTGWTANASAGDKTVSVQNFSAAGFTGTMTTALNTVSPGTGTFFAAEAQQVQDLTNKVQALEAALAASLLPNA